MLLLMTLLLACGGEPMDSGDSDPPIVGETPPAPTGCDLVEVGYDGPENPVIGDLWTIWPICDGAPVFGATVIRVDPATCGSLAENVLTWLEAGTCTVMAQTGSQRAYLEVEIGSSR